MGRENVAPLPPFSIPVRTLFVYFTPDERTESLSDLTCMINVWLRHQTAGSADSPARFRPWQQLQVVFPEEVIDSDCLRVQYIHRKCGMA